MAFTPKTWQDLPATSTPISAAALIDLETRLGAYTDSNGGGGAALGKYMRKVRRQASYFADQPTSYDYYVDSINGSNSNAGGITAPFQTIAHANSASAMGSRIGLKRGSTFNEAVIVPNDYMLYGAWGPLTAPAPIITGGGTLVIGFRDQKSGTVCQDMQISGFTGQAMLKQPASGAPGGAYKRINMNRASDVNTGQGINWSQAAGGIIEDCSILAWSGVGYSSGTSFGIIVQFAVGVEIRYNHVTGCYVGICFQGSSWQSPSIHHNIVENCHVNGIDCQGGAGAGYGPAVISNFVHHNPDTSTTAGHGIDTQSANVGPVWRNNIVVSDYSGTTGNVQLYCLAPGVSSLPGTDIDYNLGWKYPGCTANYANINGTFYATLSLFQAALVAQGFPGGNEAHGISADPLLTNFAGGDYSLTPGSPAINAGAALGYSGEAFYSPAPDLGVYDAG